MKPQQTIYQVDAFTAQPFKGNPAAVCIVPDEPHAKTIFKAKLYI